MGFEGLRPDALPEQQALLKGRAFSIHPLSAAGHLDGWRVLECTWQPILVFLFTLVLLTTPGIRYGAEGTTAVLQYVGLTVLLAYPVGAVALLLVGVGAAAAGTRVRSSAVAYWAWWPAWKLILCALAAWAGSSLGNSLWHTQLYPHARMERMQAYSGVDPRTATSTRLQDAGVVAFTASAGVDRTRSGCLHRGSTFCVAPIVPGGELAANSSEERQDFFMAGVDCCSCPGEFRCGAWDVPAAPGGLRIFDADRNDHFRLAAEEWATTHGRTLRRPMFFSWVTDPVAAYKELYDRATMVKAFALVVGPLTIVLAAVALNGAIGLLVGAKLAAPIETPLPPPGLGRALSSQLLPHMHRHYMLQQEEGGGAAPLVKYAVL